MVSPKVLKSENNGDKINNSERFKEPDGMVSIELNSKNRNHGSSEDLKTKKSNKLLLTEIIVVLFLLNVTIFGVLIFCNQETNIFRRKKCEDNQIEFENIEKQNSIQQKKLTTTEYRKKRESTSNYYYPHVEPLQQYDYIFYPETDYEYPLEEYVYYPFEYNLPHNYPINQQNLKHRSSMNKDEKDEYEIKTKTDTTVKTVNNVKEIDKNLVSNQKTTKSQKISSGNQKGSNNRSNSTPNDLLSDDIIGDTIKNDEENDNQLKNRANAVINSRNREKNDILDAQSNQPALYNPCLMGMTQYTSPYKLVPTDNNQLFQIVSSSIPKLSAYVVNPPVYPYMQTPFVVTQPALPTNHQNNGVIQVNGPGGQYYICNPISGPSNVGSMNIANMPGVEIRRDAANLQDLLGTNLSLEKPKGNIRSSETDIVCPIGYEACFDNSKCIPKYQFCDNEAQCDDGSDELACGCKERVGKLRTCDGYFDCPNGEDELGCFGCQKDEFSCDDWSKLRKGTCIPIEQRCDSITQCGITGKDEEDCTVLADNIGEQPFNKISNSVGFLHRNFKGKWYPTCFGSELWATDVCKVESGPLTVFPRTHMAITNDKYDGPFINILPNKEISIVNVCVKDRAAFVECPALYCGMRLTTRNPYRKQEVDTSAEQMLNELERFSIMRKKNLKRSDSRVVGGKPSQPTAWPWLVSIYRNGIFHCGGVLIHESWIVTAAHCSDKYWLYYYEIQAGMLRRFSYAPMEQHRWATIVVTNENYDRSSLTNDIALMKLSAAVRFNRYVRPICLPSALTAGKEFLAGPPPGTICSTVGWGATIEHGSDPDHMREVEVPILSHCKHRDDLSQDEICAGLSEGGKDACQGDSGGPLMCRNPNNPSQWYLAGIVSHGEGCARPDEPGVYTKVSKYVEWIAENIGGEKFITTFPLQHCPGFVCKSSKKCLPKKHHCDKIVDCLFGDDETGCSNHFFDLFKQARESENDDDDNKIDGANTGNETVLVDPTSITNTSNNSNNTDENSEEFFTCKSLLQLIPSKKECDKVIDCEDASDELNCTCASYVKSKNPKAICDGTSDCYDLSDEQCVKCEKYEYYCRLSQQCIDLKRRCDKKIDCSKGEDEWDCVTLTNGRTVDLDADSRPNLTTRGIVTINRNGVWRPYCLNSTEKPANIATNTCYLLGFEEYLTFNKFQLDKTPLNQNEIKTIHENNTCQGLYVKCSNVSLDNSIRGIRDNAIDEVELYTAPWNAVIYSDGIYRCMGAILNPLWIVTSINCTKHLTHLEEHYVAVLLGKGKAELPVEGPHEQTLRIVESRRIPNTDIVLLRTEKSISYNRYVKHLRLNLRRDGERREKCVAIGLFENKAKYVFLAPIKNCVVGYRCFETKIKTDCKNSIPWSGSIVCDSGSGWYSAAVYFEKDGLCGLSSVKKYTSIPYHKVEINKILEQITPDVDAPKCDGFRCSLGECINKTKTCDGITDCRGGEDEDSNLCYENEHICHLTGKCQCHFNELRCNNGICVPKSKFCDRNDDCGDLSDEPDVCDCKSYLELTNPEKICDGIVHCMDRTDEDPQICPCKPNSFNCSNSNLCISNDMVCDGTPDCPIGSDEKLCYNIVNEQNETTNAGELISRTGGIWHSGCFRNNYTPQEIEQICQNLGFSGGTSDQLEPPNTIYDINTMRPKIDDFDVIWLRRYPNEQFRIGLRTGNEPYVSFIPDDDCYKLFLACL
ncbi:serine protease nudel-like [Diorhabda sublineata]|uniref:serine protease nudel-like n=1 Tax=Diorhabda sublineata TaxID=1163346 RepID=UPI0024E04F83|nr:serine protease nudel-like [Diorhabda sublineata]